MTKMMLKLTLGSFAVANLLDVAVAMKSSQISYTQVLKDAASGEGSQGTLVTAELNYHEAARERFLVTKDLFDDHYTKEEKMARKKNEADKAQEKKAKDKQERAEIERIWKSQPVMAQNIDLPPGAIVAKNNIIIDEDGKKWLKLKDAIKITKIPLADCMRETTFKNDYAGFGFSKIHDNINRLLKISNRIFIHEKARREKIAEKYVTHLQDVINQVNENANALERKTDVRKISMRDVEKGCVQALPKTVFQFMNMIKEFRQIKIKMVLAKEILGEDYMNFHKYLQNSIAYARMENKIKETLPKNKHANKKSCQPTKDFFELREICQNSNEQYKKSVESISELFDKKLPLSSYKIQTAPIKGEERCKYKLIYKYDYDASLLTDIVRASIIFDDVCSVVNGKKVYNVVEAIKILSSPESQKATGLKVVGIKNRFRNVPDNGYSDVLLNVEFDGEQTVLKDGVPIKKPVTIVGEIQVHLGPLKDVKDGKGWCAGGEVDGHKIYEGARHFGPLFSDACFLEDGEFWYPSNDGEVKYAWYDLPQGQYPVSKDPHSDSGDNPYIGDSIYWETRKIKKTKTTGWTFKRKNRRAIKCEDFNNHKALPVSNKLKKKVTVLGRCLVEIPGFVTTIKDRVFASIVKHVKDGSIVLIHYFNPRSNMVSEKSKTEPFVLKVGSKDWLHRNTLAGHHILTMKGYTYGGPVEKERKLKLVFSTDEDINEFVKRLQGAIKKLYKSGMDDVVYDVLSRSNSSRSKVSHSSLFSRDVSPFSRDDDAEEQSSTLRKFHTERLKGGESDDAVHSADSGSAGAP